MTEQRPISLRDLAFVRDVLIPRAWVSGDEVDELVRLRDRLDRYFDGLRQPPSPPAPPTPARAAPAAPEAAAAEVAPAP
ncbi:MAG: hypothetical protein AB7N76_26495 [Planctomycetota bacterium]